MYPLAQSKVQEVDGGSSLDLNTADQRNSVDQTGISARHREIVLNAETRHCRTQPQSLVRIDDQFVHLRDSLDVHQKLGSEPSFAHMH